jgi:predicted Zn-dependent protease
MRGRNRICAARWTGALLAALAALSLTGCRTKSFLSTRQEVGLGKEGARQVDQEFLVDTATPDAERVRRVGLSLLAHMDRRDVPYTFKVIDSKEINAFSLPGGPVYIFRGLLDVIGDDDDALACILGHECGHVNARHAARQISSNIINSILLSFVPTPAGQNLAGLGMEIASLKYSRDDEYEADRRGLSYAYHAGYNPEGMVRFFNKLARIEKRVGGSDPEWMQNHPVTPARIAKAEVIIETKNFRYGQ